MRVGILTSHDLGFASYAVPKLLERAKGYEVEVVFLNTGVVPRNRKWWKRKLRKTRRIGVLGVLIGFWMRRWYDEDTVSELELEPLSLMFKSRPLQTELIAINGLNGNEMRAAIKSSGVDLVLSLGNSFIAPSIFSIPKFGMWNIHHEQLPAFRNAQSVIWQLYYNNRITGYTIHEISRTIDGGRILVQNEIPIVFQDSLSKTVSKTYAELWKRSVEGLCDSLNQFGHLNSSAKEQVLSGGHYTTPSFLQFFRIWNNWRRLRRQD